MHMNLNRNCRASKSAKECIRELVRYAPDPLIMLRPLIRLGKGKGRSGLRAT
jgi:hypothetical protein